MLPNKTLNKKGKKFSCLSWQLFFLVSSSVCTVGEAQICPPNIDFEKGTFEGWNCYSGSVAEVDGENVISLMNLGPISGKHTIFARSAVTQLDPYGEFPVVCPNGSGYSIRLGNDLAGTEAEGISYEFTIPADRNVYSLIYHYAVVFQDPHHLDYQQPRMEVEIKNVTDNTIISCSSFTFFPIGSPLPGFFLSNASGATPVWCKDWSAVSINLDGNAGKTIRLFFKTADCTFRRHFGYAYIDVNTECSGDFAGTSFCPGDTAIQINAPYGYQTYTWFNNNFSNVLGQQEILTLKPSPPAGTTLAVEVIPYFGYGCIDTLYTTLNDTLTIKAVAGSDKQLCKDGPVEIGAVPKAGVIYSWSPSMGLTDPTIANPFAAPQTTTSYILTSRSYGGGCIDSDTVTVTPVDLDNTIKLLGKAAFCFGSGDSAVLQLAAADSIQWYRDNNAIVGSNGMTYKVNQSGLYHAKLYKSICMETTEKKLIYIEKAKPGLTYPILYVVANEHVSLEARNFGNTVMWYPSQYLNTNTSYKPVFFGSTDQVYTIELTTNAGCLTIDTQMIKIVKQADILVPTAFTPNNDGKNDVLRPILFGIKEIKYFRVYNRWGQLLFESKNASRGWDGTYLGKKQGSQVVVWMAEGIGMDGKTYFRKGTTVCVQ